MDLGIENKVALITGASKNLGKAICRELAKEGAIIIAVSRDKNALHELISILPGEYKKHFAISLDLLDNSGVDTLLNKLALEKISPDIVVHNLGGSLQIKNPFSLVGNWEQVWRFNLGVAISINNFLIPEMLSKNWGRILHVSTLSTQSNQGYAPYISAKYALEGYVKAVSQTISKNNVVMNAIAPGLIDIEDRYYGKLKKENSPILEEYFTNNLPIRRMGSLNEIAILAAFMCSNHSSFMPGSIVRIDGGGR